MTALAADATRQMKIKNQRLHRLPVAASTTIYKGGMICIDADGFAIPAADTAGLSSVVGIAVEGIDNSSGSDGDLNVEIASNVDILLAASGVTQVMVKRETMYVEDDNLVDDITGVTNDIAVGEIVEFVSTTSVWVHIPTFGLDGVPNALLAAGGPGYVTGEGGAVTQITDDSTGVTLSELTGQITTVALTLAAAAETTFIVTNTKVVATDIVAVSSTYAGAGTPVINIRAVGAGVFSINIVNVHASAALNALMVINFAVIKGVAA